MASSAPLQQDFSRPSEGLVGKLKPGISTAAAEAELTSLTRELVREQPRYFRNAAAGVKPVLVGQFEFVEWTLDDHLRHSRFVGLRDDNEPDEVRREI